MSLKSSKAEPDGDDGIDFDEVLSRAIALLKEKKRISYGALRLELKVDEELFAAIRDEIVDSQKLAHEEDGKVLVWTGSEPEAPQPEPDGGDGSDFDEALNQAIALLKEKKRISYAALRLELLMLH
jgi:hypothetical protein